MKHRLSVIGMVVAALAAGVGVAFAMGILNLPMDQVTVSHGPWPARANSTLDITLSDVPPGYDVMNETYPGWCIEDNFQPDYSGPGVYLLDSTDSDPLECDPNDYPGYPWDKINYLLNNKGTATIENTQVAM